ncbi:MAG TPA: hypothetical protein VGY97_00920 [Solirubrobacteraceae bacterium]|nr:hypothetical protein [Solirubrobacteraceae bacterium]
MPDLPAQRPSPTADAPRAGRFEVLGAWLHVWTPPRGVVIPPVPWRRLAAGGVVGGLVLTGLGLWLVPRIEQAKRNESRREQRQVAVFSAQERTRLARDQQLHRSRAARLPSLRAPAGAHQRAAALVADLEASITADARARARAGSLGGPVARTECQPYPPSAAGAGRRAPAGVAPASKYECVAVTGDIHAGTGNIAGVVGYPFWARVDLRTGTYLWCKINPLPGERAAGQQPASVPLPRPCDLEAR